jgi:hypothetical protein
MPAGAVYVGRGTKYGNPFRPKQIGQAFQQKGCPSPIIAFREKASLERCLDLYLARIWTLLQLDPNYLEDLRGKDLACWCSLDSPCHADILLRLANELPE